MLSDSGGGHRSPAEAIVERLRNDHESEIDLEVVDLTSAAGAHHTDAMIKRGWRYMLRRHWLARAAYVLAHLFFPITALVPYVLHRDLLHRTRRFLRGRRPDLVVSTYHFASTAVAWARHREGMAFPIVTVMTETFECNIWWVNRRIDALIVASEQARRWAIRYGMPRDRLHVFPFPINTRFEVPSPQRRDELRRNLRLSPERPAILVSTGAEGIGRGARYALGLFRDSVPVNLMMVCGRNERLRERIERMKACRPTSSTNLLVFGFVNNMHDLLAAADVVVAKASPSSTFEALITGVPVIHTDWVTFNEWPNIVHVTRYRFGWFVPDRWTFRRLVDQLVTTDELRRASERIAAAKIRSGAAEIAAYLAERYALTSRRSAETPEL